MKKIAALAGMALVLSACAALSDSGAKEGECVDIDFSASVVGDLKGFDCAKEHDAEIYERSDVALDGGFDDAAIDALAVDVCMGAFRDYVGSVYETSTLDVYYMYPDEAGWKAGDREVVCAVYTPTEDYSDSVRTSGSVKGSGK